MPLQEKIKEDLKNAMREKNELRLSVLRMLQSALHNRLIEKRAKENGAVLSEEEVISTLRSEVKKRKDAIREFTKGKRPELAEKEARELKILENYLPTEIDDAAIEVVVAEVIKEMGSATIKDFGKIMAGVMKRVQETASGDRVSAVVKKFLS